MKTVLQLVLLATLALSGCIDGDLKECPKTQGIILKFRDLEAGVDVFSKTISSVHLFVFDRYNGQFVTSKQIDKAALAKLQGAELDLPVGDYQIVCWANANLNSELYISSKIADINNPIQAYLLDAKVNPTTGYAQNGDKLYYAPYSNSNSFFISLPASAKTEYLLDFRTAHSVIEVYVTGFTDLFNQSSNLSPNIELTNITPKYDFKLNQFGDPTTYKQTTHKQNREGVETQVASFNVPLCEKNKDINIVLRKQSNNQIIESINMKAFVAEHYSQINLSSPETQTIKIEFKYINGNVSISVPTWKDDVISPEI